MDYLNFVDGEKTLIVAPAGYGKTHTIVECLNYTSGRQLILTHTHAGIASIKKKIKLLNIDSNRYCIETISSFAQKYVKSFYMGEDIPNQEDSKHYHPFIISKATGIFKSNLIKMVLKATYTGLFVDEYQDCTKIQHEMILGLAESLKTHILGDPLQGIFDFNGDLISFDSDLSEFTQLPDLQIPHRWNKAGNNPALGEFLRETRNLLQQKKWIDLSNKSINGLIVIKVDPEDIRDSHSLYRRSLNKLITNPEHNPDFDSLLIIVPEYIDKYSKKRKGNINDRVQIRSQIDYGKNLVLIEAIDDKNFYVLSKAIDELFILINTSSQPIKLVKEKVLERLFQKTSLDEWFNEIEIKNKKDKLQNTQANYLKKYFSKFLQDPNSRNLKKIIHILKNEIKLKYSRDGLLYAILNALTNSDIKKISVYEAMKEERNFIRRNGRKVEGKCIGTTLLTKGLEFDTVVILDADKFDNPKNFYVAITRCCKRLIIFTSKEILSPYT